MRDGDEKDETGEKPDAAEAEARPSLRPSMRPSQRPSRAPSPWIGVRRVLFALLWIGGQLALILTADRRSDGAFGFRTFNESSTLTVVLYREVEGPNGERVREKTDAGSWTARDDSGMARRFAWSDRVKRPDLALEREIAVGSAATQVARWRAALDDVAAHVPNDAETHRFLADVTVRRNGREPYVVHLASFERKGGS